MTKATGAHGIGRAAEQFCRRGWSRLPERLRRSRPGRGFAGLIYARAWRAQGRAPQASYSITHTLFYRNRPQLAALADIAARFGRASVLHLAVLGCSTGAEVFSTLQVIHACRPDLQVHAVGMDIAEAAVTKAATGVFDSEDREVRKLSPAQQDLVFDRHGSRLQVRESLRAGTSWLVGDACQSDLLELLGPQDIVLANNVLIHMTHQKAARCLRNIVRLAPGGFVCIWGMHLDLRARLARELDLTPWLDRLDEIHEADVPARTAWPWAYWGLEPVDRRRTDWPYRYATIFQVPAARPATMQADA